MADHQNRQQSLFEYDETYSLPVEGDLREIQAIQAGTGSFLTTPSGEEVVLWLQRSWGSPARFSFIEQIHRIVDGHPNVDDETRLFVKNATSKYVYQFEFGQIPETVDSANPEYGIHETQYSVYLKSARRTHEVSDFSDDVGEWFKLAKSSSTS